MEDEKCVVCGKDNEGGTYVDLPVCFTCYTNGTLLPWLKENQYEDKEEKNEKDKG